VASQTKEVFEMAASRFIEEESGTFTGFQHQHNGYYAGDFSQAPLRLLDLRSIFPKPGVVSGSSGTWRPYL